MDNQHKITGLHLTYALDSRDGVKKNVQPERPRPQRIIILTIIGLALLGVLAVALDSPTGSVSERGGFAPSLTPLPSPLGKGRGIKGEGLIDDSKHY